MRDDIDDDPQSATILRAALARALSGILRKPLDTGGLESDCSVDRLVVFELGGEMPSA
ncbi:MAG TPA: hypothetical protein VJ276_08400 [Thermoanaerobaculia bacterium]|nr:hypothetical protein [Thermoanaerobaculia bacterium]